MSFHRTARYKNGQLVICETAEHVELLEANGWTSEADPAAGWVPNFDFAFVGKDPEKPARVVGADTNGDGKIDKVFKPKGKPGPKKK